MLIGATANEGEVETELQPKIDREGDRQRNKCQGREIAKSNFRDRAGNEEKHKASTHEVTLVSKS